MTRARRRRGERGLVAGADTVLVGTVVVVALTLLATQAWGVADRRARLERAAAEYLRTYTEADDPLAASRDAGAAARSVLGLRLAAVTSLTDPDPAGFGPCAPARVTLHSVVPAVRLPFRLTFGQVDVRVTRSELVDAHRAMTAGPSYRSEDTPCGR